MEAREIVLKALSNQTGIEQDEIKETDLICDGLGIDSIDYVELEVYILEEAELPMDSLEFLQVDNDTTVLDVICQTEAFLCN